jgi:uncharacterized protein YndB with AHSA1/START domain
MEQVIVERTLWISAPRDRVWQAITDPLQLEQWYAPGCKWEIASLKKGAEVRFFNTETDIQTATIESIEPPERLTLRWRVDLSASLLNTFTLEERDSGTQVTITQSGYETLSAEDRQMWIDADQSAYTSIVENLKAYLEG